MGICPGPDGDGTERLCDIIYRAQRKAAFLVLHIRKPGDQDHGNVFGHHCLLKSAQQGEAIDIRHDNVQEDQGKLAGLRKTQSFLAALAGGHIIILD